MARVFAGPQDLAAAAAAAFGPGRRLAGVERLRAGSKKGVYRLSFDDETSVIGYVWGAGENYWPAAGAPDTGADPIADASGAGLFEPAQAELRFGRDYPALRPHGLDQERMRFYRLAMHLSLIAGPLRLLDGDFPHREAMMRIVDYNIGRALCFVR